MSAGWNDAVSHHILRVGIFINHHWTGKRYET